MGLVTRLENGARTFCAEAGYGAFLLERLVLHVLRRSRKQENRRTEHGERRTENGERENGRTGERANRERRTGERRTERENGERRTENGSTGERRKGEQENRRKREKKWERPNPDFLVHPSLLSTLKKKRKKITEKGKKRKREKGKKRKSEK